MLLSVTHQVARVRDGFSLLELMIALLIFTGGVIAIIWAFSAGMSATTDIENVDLALHIAQAKMEEIKNTPFANLTDSGPTADPRFSNFNTAVNVGEGQNPMPVEVTVAWNVKGGSANITLTTLAASY